MDKLYNRMYQLFQNNDIAHADETVLHQLRELARSATSNSYLWLYRTGKEGEPIVLYDYQES